MPTKYGEMTREELHPRCRRTRVFLLFHWSPRSRRRSIRRHGLRIGSKHVCHSGGGLDGTPWRADYLCFSDWPGYAWTYSAGTTREAQEWDLWVVRSDLVGPITYRWDHKGQSPAELRTWQDIPASALLLVASRHHRPRGSKSAPPTKRTRSKK